MRVLTAAGVALALVASGCGRAAPVPGSAGTFTWGSGAGARRYIVYTPARWRARQRVPLVVVLHGCTTTARQMMESSRYDAVAEAHDFVVVYPEVTQAEASMPGFDAYCWAFWQGTDWVRGGYDPGPIAAITRAVTRRWSIDPRRVYLVGISAGAFLASDMAALYPDLYAAVAEAAGGAFADFDCRAGVSSNVSVQQSAEYALGAEGPRARVTPRFVIGGSADEVVPPACATKALLQGLRTDNLVLDRRQTAPIRLTPVAVSQERPAVTGGHPYRVGVYADQYGCELGERVLVQGMQHFWSGGSAQRRWQIWSDPRGPSAAQLSWAFLSRYELGVTPGWCRQGRGA